MPLKGPPPRGTGGCLPFPEQLRTGDPSALVLCLSAAGEVPRPPRGAAGPALCPTVDLRARGAQPPPSPPLPSQEGGHSRMRYVCSQTERISCFGFNCISYCSFCSLEPKVFKDSREAQGPRMVEPCCPQACPGPQGSLQPRLSAAPLVVPCGLAGPSTGSLGALRGRMPPGAAVVVLRDR